MGSGFKIVPAAAAEEGASPDSDAAPGARGSTRPRCCRPGRRPEEALPRPDD